MAEDREFRAKEVRIAASGSRKPPHISVPVPTVVLRTPLEDDPVLELRMSPESADAFGDFVSGGEMTIRIVADRFLPE